MYTWDLTDLYTNLNDPKFLADNKALEQVIVDLHKIAETFNSENPAKKLKNYLLKLEEWYQLVYKLQNFINLTLQTDATNKDYNDALVVLRQKLVQATLPNTLFQKYVAQIENLGSVIKEDPLLKDYQFLLIETKKQSNHLLSDQEEILAAELSQSGGTLYSKMQRYLTSTHEVVYDNKRLPLSVIRNMAYDPDPSVRQSAYEAELKSYIKIAKPLSFAMNGIKKEVTTISKKRNYQSPLIRTLEQSRITEEVLNSLISAIHEYLPAFRKYLRKKAEYLGHDNGLPFYDLFAPMGIDNNKYSIEEAQAFILQNFASFSQDLHDLAKKAFNDNWVDYLPRSGKTGGAFCARIYPIKESRILTNYDGSMNAISTLAHELGHAYHNHHIFKERILNSDYPMPIAETASILCERIVKDSALDEAETKEQKMRLIEQELQGATQVIVDILSRFIFESNVFKRVEREFLDENTLNNMMIEAQKEAYGNGLDWNYLHAGMWINKSHYYSTIRSYYNFPYAFGLLFANGIYSLYKTKGKAFVNDLQKLLRMSGKDNLINVAKSINIDITDINYWKASLDVIKEKIDQFIDLLNE